MLAAVFSPPSNPVRPSESTGMDKQAPSAGYLFFEELARGRHEWGEWA